MRIMIMIRAHASQDKVHVDERVDLVKTAVLDNELISESYLHATTAKHIS